MADIEPAVITLHEQINTFLSSLLGQEGDQQCSNIEIAAHTPGFQDDVLRRWDLTNPGIADQESLPEIVGSIINTADVDSAGRDGRCQYVVRTRHRHGGSAVFRFSTNGAAVEPDDDDEQEQSPYYHTTVHTFRISNPLEIEITSTRMLHAVPGEHSTVHAIRINNPLEIESTSSVDSSHLPPAPPQRQNVPLEAIIAAIQPFIAQFFQKLDDSRARRAPEPEN